MLPPLRSAADVAAAQQAAAAGMVDFIGSDHAPHAVAEKNTTDPWSCPSGTPGLDTLAAAALDLAARQIIGYPQVAALLAERPARLFGLADRKGRIAVGADADLVLVDPEAMLHVTPAAIRSRAARSPFEGRHAARPAGIDRAPRRDYRRGWQACRAAAGRPISARAGSAN